ncbi:MAG: tRNA (N6-threonylcarbamoyladenosine(37)-N6)-methyltransferase TrmO [Bacteroidales bacterium]|nr:tRNA (N6-threonylcarbamoyladenosine(37)-N6)-methyltransferase TrmO [Bacteroidales bacterium]
MQNIIIKPIGIIHTPYKTPKDIPIQGIFKNNIEGFLSLNEKYCEGLKDLEAYSHAILIYHFDRSQKEDLISKPFLENEEHGIFAIRSPHRPNHIGLSIVKIKKIIENKVYFTEVDMLDKTPLIDIKPFVKQFDNRENVVSGWVDKHFTNGNIPDRVIL